MNETMKMSLKLTPPLNKNSSVFDFKSSGLHVGRHGPISRFPLLFKGVQ